LYHKDFELYEAVGTGYPPLGQASCRLHHLRL
jgi:hypothetical protein